MSTMGRGLEVVLREHPFFVGLFDGQLELLAGCGRNERYEEGSFLFRENEPADHFFILRHGKVRVEIHSSRRGPIVLETLGAGEVLGWSWLIPLYKWRFDARAMELTRAIALDGKCLRTKCEENPALGYEMLKRFSAVFAERLKATRLQILDVYGHRPKK